MFFNFIKSFRVIKFSNCRQEFSLLRISETQNMPQGINQALNNHNE